MGRKRPSAYRALKPQTHSRADIVDAGVLAAKQSGVAKVDPADFDREARGEAEADAELGLEQDAAAQREPVGAIERVGRAVQRDFSLPPATP